MKFLLIILAVTALVFAAGLFLRSRPSELERESRAPAEGHAAALRAAVRAYIAHKSGGLEELKKNMAPLDDYEAVDTVMKSVRGPDFDKAAVVSPSFDQSMFYVRAPDRDGKIFQFTVKRTGDRPLLQSVSVCR
jgi:hypothetical protein